MKKARKWGRRLFQAKRKQQGQGMTEYIIIVVLIAIGLIAAVKLFGGTLKRIFTTSEKTMKDKVEPAASGDLK
ncbi:MAG: Flp family type IVb pilin [Planctomycetota bacterium]|nr:MAG: Flp family type IVb pilin [Planctomycetota bacterium]